MSWCIYNNYTFRIIPLIHPNTHFFKKMPKINMNWVFLSFFAHSFLTICLKAEQEYSGNSIFSCNNNDTLSPSPAFLYTCKGQYNSCQAFLIFMSEPPYDSVSTISALASSDSSELARINNVTTATMFPVGQEVIVPVNCSCAGQYYQANTTFRIPENRKTYLMVANDTYQGLSTCDAIKQVNAYSEFHLYPGLRLQVPLRCACPTKEQVEANGFSEENPTLFPFTTILIPQPTEPLSSQTIIRKPILGILPSPTSIVPKNSSQEKLTVTVIIATGCPLIIFVLVAAFWIYKKRVKEASRSDEEGETEGESQEDLHVEIASFDQVLRVYSFEELIEVTDGFASKSKVRNSVYKGVSGGKILAIKKMSFDVSKEVNMLSKINHINLIKLHGICKHFDSFYLVYEYMKNGSLREWLCSEGSKEASGWIKRIQIALDVANGLHYLHNFTKPAYVHKDIKSSNILLDCNLNILRRDC